MSSVSSHSPGSTNFGAEKDPGLAMAVLASRIAIIDNRSTEFLALRKVLSEEGYHRITMVEDLTRALQEIRQADPDLIVMDPFAGNDACLNLFKMLREDEVLQDASIVVLTKSTNPQDEERCRELGASAFFALPVAPREVSSVVYTLMEADLNPAGTQPDKMLVHRRTAQAKVASAENVAAHPDYKSLKEIEKKPASTLTTRRSAATTGQASEEMIGESRIRASKIVIVDDEPFNFMVLRKFLTDDGYANILTTSDSTTAVETIRSARPDLVILDVVMPQVDGIEILTELKADKALCSIPVLILTATADARVKRNALDIGASDFLNKPVDSNDLLPRVRNSILYKLQQDQLRDYAQFLEDQVRLRTSELIESRRDIVRCLARAGEYRDTQTGYHVLRVGMYAGLIADELGFSAAEVEDIELAAQLHDLGKIAIPDSILLKPGKLTPEEIREMRRHCRIGTKIIQPDPVVTAVGRGSGPNPNRLTQMAAMIASTHHEHWDGSGYPCGLSGEQIPIEGRITAVADVFDALSSKRPYKEAFDFDECFDIMESDRGKQFDPAVLDALIARREEIIQVRLSHDDG